MTRAAPARRLRSLPAAALSYALLAPAPPARADGGADPPAGIAPRPGALRVFAGPGVSLDPAAMALTGGVDLFPGAHVGGGLGFATTFPDGREPGALERRQTFFGAVLRVRSQAGARLRLEGSAGGGLARVAYGSPGAHVEWAPDLAVGLQIALPLAARFELALAADAHATFGERTITRNHPHVTLLTALCVRLLVR